MNVFIQNVIMCFELDKKSAVCADFLTIKLNEEDLEELV